MNERCRQPWERGGRGPGSWGRAPATSVAAGGGQVPEHADGAGDERHGEAPGWGRLLEGEEGGGGVGHVGDEPGSQPLARLLAVAGGSEDPGAKRHIPSADGTG